MEEETSDLNRTYSLENCDDLKKQIETPKRVNKDTISLSVKRDQKPCVMSIFAPGEGSPSGSTKSSSELYDDSYSSSSFQITTPIIMGNPNSNNSLNGFLRPKSNNTREIFKSIKNGMK